MEDTYSVSSPRRILSRSKKRRATVSSLDAGERAYGFGVCGEHGPKPSEVYGFVGSITTVVAAGSLHRSCFYFMFRLETQVKGLPGLECVESMVPSHLKFMGLWVP